MTDNERKITLSAVLSDDTIIETVYDSKKGVTNFAITQGGKYQITDIFITEKGTPLQPFLANSDLLTSNFLRLPSDVGKYENNESLFGEVRDYIRKYVHLPNSFLTIATLYVIMTWVYDRFDTIPYLRVIGNYGTGKTRFLNVIGNLSYKGMMAGGSITTAATFRTLDQIQGTLVFDEADFRSSELWSEIIKILNSGHTKNFPVIRMNVSNKKDGYETKSFKVYGPKILASRERFGDEALESRSLTQVMQPIINTDKPIHYQSSDNEAENIKNKLLAFRLKNYFKIEADESTVQELEFPRLKQSALAITTIAKFIGIPEVISESLNFLKEYERELTISQQSDVKADILICIGAVCKSEPDTKKLRIGEIASIFSHDYYNDFTESLTKIAEIPNNAMSSRKIGSIVRKMGIKTERDGNGFYIPLPQELEKIKLLINRYGLKELVDKRAEQRVTEGSF